MAGEQHYENQVKEGMYVPRRTNAFDKNVGNFTTDGTWKVNGLDLSAIVPSEAIAVHLRIYLADDAAASMFIVRTNATDTHNQIYMMIQVANQPMESHAILAIDSDGLLDYQGSNLAFQNIDVVVLGWFI